MTERCPGCSEPIRFWQRKGPESNDSWHRRCYISWENGNRKAWKICNELCDYYNLPTPRALYVYQNSEVGILLDRLKRDIAKKLEKALELFKQ